MPRCDDAKLIDKDTGTEIRPGDMVPDFRGDPTRFLYVSRLPESGKEGKIMTERSVGGEVYASVLNARVVPGEQATD